MTQPKETVDLSRRSAAFALAAGGAVLLSGCTAHAEPAKPTATGAGSGAPAPGPAASGSAFAGKHEIVPLPFNASSLNGLSEKLITSHHDNNYAGAVKNLNKIEVEISQVPKDAPPFLLGGLKQSELIFRNSATLHELYFANLGGDGKASGAVEKAVSDAYGTFGKWEEQFRTTGMSLGGGSGWVVLAWDLLRDTPYTFWSGNHSQVQALGAPLLVMDMYEHAYQMDYGAAAAKYIDAFFLNVKWDEVNKRLERAKKAAAALRA
jgi:Fe-Mn family superoxide dismutase